MTQNVAMSFSPLDPQFEARVRASFARRRAMETIGATLGRVEPGVVEVALTYRGDLTQQQGDRFVATGHVVRAGQTITVCSGDMVAYGEPGERLVATMLATVFTAPERDGLKQ